MARSRTFDENQVVHRAMLTFWRHGYEATSIGMLESATGISRISMYNAFGDKKQLFLKALDTYGAETRAHFASREFRDGGLSSIISLLQAAAKKRPVEAPEHFGCLMLNTILDLDTAGTEAQDIIAVTRKAMVQGLIDCMRQAIRSGEMGEVPGKVLRDRGEFLVAVLWGSRTFARLESEVTAARGAIRAAAEVVRGWAASQASAGPE